MMLAYCIVALLVPLQFVLKRMSAFERHPSVTEQAVSNTWKIALALFINSACVVLLVNLPGPFSVSVQNRKRTGAPLASVEADGLSCAAGGSAEATNNTSFISLHCNSAPPQIAQMVYDNCYQYKMSSTSVRRFARVSYDSCSK